jgi:Tol biopolymer transport system component
MSWMKKAALLVAVAIVPACGGGSSGSGGMSNEPFIPVAWFVATAHATGVGELFAANADGSTIVPLSGVLEATAQGVVSFKLSPNRKYVAFVAQIFAPPAGFFVYVVPSDGGVPVLVTFGSVGDGTVPQYDWSPDGSKIAYIHDGNSFGTFELYVSNFDGTGGVKVNQTSALDRDVFSFKWSPDGTRLAYIADEDTNDVHDLYTALADGTGATKVNGTLDPFTAVGQYAWAPDGSRIAYLANQGDPGFFPVYTALADGTGNVLVSPLQAFSESGNGFVSTPFFQWAPDSSRIAYLADQEVDGKIELFTVLPDGTGNVKVSGTLTAGGNVSSPNLTYAWSPDSALLAFIADKDADEDFALYVATPTGSSVTKVSPALVAGGDVSMFGWAPDSSRLAYVADQDVDEQFELYSVRPNGTSPVRVSGATAAGGDLLDFAWSPDSSQLAYVADQRLDGQFELFVSTATGTGNRRLSGDLVAGGDVSSPVPGRFFEWTLDGKSVVYIADQDTDEVYEVFASPLSGNAGNARICTPLALGGDAWSIATR